MANKKNKSGKPKLPKGWEWKKLGAIVNTKKGKTPERTYLTQKEESEPYILIESFEGNYMKFTDDLHCTACDEEDVLIVWDGARSGLCATGLSGYAGSTIGVISPYDCLNTMYLFYFIKSNYNLLNGNTKGSGIPHVRGKLLKSLEIPLPPLAEQRRIVAVLDELIGKAQKALELRKQAAEEAEAVLKSTSNRVFLKGFTNAENEGYWKITKLIGIVSNDKYSIKRGPFGSSIRKDCFVSSGYKVYQQMNAIYNDFSIGDYFIDDEKFNELENFALEPRDIIISCSGTIGKIAIAPKGIQKGVINQALLKLSLNEDIILPEFYVYLFKSNLIQEQLHELTPGSAMKNVASVKKLKSIKYPLPPLPEQRRIVEHLDSLSAKVSELKRFQSETQEELTALVPAILEVAFKGEL